MRFGSPLFHNFTHQNLLLVRRVNGYDNFGTESVSAVWFTCILIRKQVNWYGVAKETGGGPEAPLKPMKGFIALASDTTGPLRLQWTWGLGGVADRGLLPVGRF
jgi:hypothetical protein